MSTDTSILDHATATALRSAAETTDSYARAGVLKPSIFIDGDQWCVLYGKNLHEGVAGFGDTPHDAMLAWDRAWYTTIKKLES